MHYSMSTILKAVAAAGTKEEKLAILRRADCDQIRTVIQYALHPHVVWLLPKGDVPYKPTQMLDQEGRLYTEARKLYLYVKAGGNVGHPTLTQSRREMLFIQMLESIHPDDAAMMVQVKDKKLFDINPHLINEAYPGLIHVEEQETPEVVRQPRGTDEPKKAAGVRGEKKKVAPKKGPKAKGSGVPGKRVA